MDPGNRTAVIAALVANVGIALAKFAGYLVTGASSMLAEAVHSVADSGNQALLLWGGASARRQPTPEHPFGYGRERYFWAFVVSVVLFVLGSVFALYEGIHKLQHPEPLTSPIWAVGLLVLGLVLETGSFRMALREARKLKGAATWMQFVRRTKNPELPVVLLEDFGALVGLVLALAGVGLSWMTGNPVFDSSATICIGVLLGVIAWVLAVEMKSLLIGESASAAHRDRIRAAIEAAPLVRRLISMRTQHLGPDELLVGSKVEFDAALEFRAVTDAIDGVEAAIRGAVPIVTVIYIEPDVWTAEQSSHPHPT